MENDNADIIFTVHKELLQKLNEKNVRDRSIINFDKHEKVIEKIEYVEKMLIENELIPVFTNCDSKNDNKSLALRKKGNKMFENENYIDALLFYNESICHANNTEYLAISYANRSAVYFQLKMYKICLDNIELAKNAGYPKRYLLKINKRKENCLKEIKKGKQKQNVDDTEKLPLKLAFPAHSFITSASNCIDVKQSKDKGRHILANRELRPGQVVSIEKTMYQDLLPKFNYQRCANCLQEKQFNLMPCNLCTNTMFCSKICMNESENGFHQYLCPINDYFNGILHHDHINAIRIAIKVICSFKSVQNLKELLEKITSDQKLNAFINKKNAIQDDKYYQLYSVVGLNEMSIPVENRFQQAVVASVACQQLLKNNISLDTSDDFKAMLKELIYRFLLAIPTHSQNLSMTLSYENQNQTSEIYARGIFAVAALINHSCEHNVDMANHGSKLIIRVVRPIKKGGELLWHNKIHHIHLNKVERNLMVKNIFNITCNCRACVNDYPLMHNTLSINLFGFRQFLSYITDCYTKRIDKQTAESYFKKILHNINQYESIYLCQEVLYGIVNLGILLKIICNEGSFRAIVGAKFPKKVCFEDFLKDNAQALMAGFVMDLYRHHMEHAHHF